MGFVQVRNMIAVLHATQATQSYKIYECHVRVKGSQCTYIDLVCSRCTNTFARNLFSWLK